MVSIYIIGKRSLNSPEGVSSSLLRTFKSAPHCASISRTSSCEDNEKQVKIRIDKNAIFHTRFTYMSPTCCCVHRRPQILVHGIHIDVLLQQELHDAHIAIGRSYVQLQKGGGLSAFVFVFNKFVCSHLPAWRLDSLAPRDHHRCAPAPLDP